MIAVSTVTVAAILFNWLELVAGTACSGGGVHLLARPTSDSSTELPGLTKTMAVNCALHRLRRKDTHASVWGTSLRLRDTTEVVSILDTTCVEVKYKQ